MALSTGCAQRSYDQVQPGVTTESALKANSGQPLAERKPEIRPEARLLYYPDDCCYQVERGIVVAVACAPVGSELALQHWRHRWAGQTQRFEALSDSANVHGQKQYQFASKEAGMAVIYDEATERVVRVVRYGTR
jgi:hypothetical protein